LIDLVIALITVSAGAVDLHIFHDALYVIACF